MEVSRERWMCQDVVRIYIMNYDSDKKKKTMNEKLPFATTWTDLELIILGEGCQA